MIPLELSLQVSLHPALHSCLLPFASSLNTTLFLNQSSSSNLDPTVPLSIFPSPSSESVYASHFHFFLSFFLSPSFFSSRLLFLPFLFSLSTPAFSYFFLPLISPLPSFSLPRFSTYSTPASLVHFSFSTSSLYHSLPCPLFPCPFLPSFLPSYQISTSFRSIIPPSFFPYFSFSLVFCALTPSLSPALPSLLPSLLFFLLQEMTG